MLETNLLQIYNFFFYLENIYRMAKPDFLPTDQDILHIYTPTKGIYEYTYETNFCIEEIIFNIIDVGGNKDERKKWIYCLDNDTLKMTVEMLTRACRGEETCTRGVSGA